MYCLSMVDVPVGVLFVQRPNQGTASKVNDSVIFVSAVESLVYREIIWKSIEVGIVLRVA